MRECDNHCNRPSHNLFYSFTKKLVWKVQQGTFFGKITRFPEVWSVSFDIRPRGVVDGWNNIIHFTATGNNCCGVGDRIPGVWFHSRSTELLICSTVNNKGENYYKSKSLPMNKFTHVVIKQEKQNHAFFYTIHINGKQVSKMENHIPRVYNNVQVWGSDIWHAAANAELRNLEFSKLGKYYFLFFIYTNFDTIVAN